MVQSDVPSLCLSGMEQGSIIHLVRSWTTANNQATELNVKGQEAMRATSAVDSTSSSRDKALTMKGQGVNSQELCQSAWRGG